MYDICDISSNSSFDTCACFVSLVRWIFSPHTLLLQMPTTYTKEMHVALELQDVACSW